MPANVVKTPADEKDWEKAKEIADEAGRKDDYAYIMGIFKKMNPERFKAATHVPSVRHVISMYENRPSPARVVRQFLASWVPGEVRDDNWDPGMHDPTPPPEGEGSQVPPVREGERDEAPPAD